MDGDVLLTVDELAAELGISPGTIYVWRARGFIEPATKRGRFHLYSLADGFRCERERLRKHRRRKGDGAARGSVD